MAPTTAQADVGVPVNRILVTGFEPFGGDDVNPSAMLAQALHGSRLTVQGEQVRVEGHVLPCVFDDALAALRRMLDDVRPSMILCTGLAVGREGLSFERVAVNLVDARIPDNRGAQPVDARVVRTAVNAHFTRLPVKAMVQAATACNVPASLSMSAGTYVCNAVFFALMHWVARIERETRDASRRTQGSGTVPVQRRLPTPRGGFMHLPMLPAQAKRHGPLPSLPFEAMLSGTRAALTAAWRCDHDLAEAGGTVA